MPNLAATLKEEIRRLARKEIRVQMGATRRAAVQHRREIARLKKELADAAAGDRGAEGQDRRTGQRASRNAAASPRGRDFPHGRSGPNGGG